jgi:cation diffusion facilitator family transporter
MPESRSLTRFAWLSIAAALTTMGLKAVAFLVTGSVGLLSDALESSVNLVAAVVALVVLTIASRPPDEEHAYGHDKAEYFSAGVEGTMIVLAALSIAYAAINRLLNPVELERLGVGLVISIVAALVNLAVAIVLLRAGRAHRSITLEADGKHLMTDVWTSAGVVIGVAAVAVTGWDPLDPIIALLVAVNIVFSGSRLVRRSVRGLMDVSIPTDQVAVVRRILEEYRSPDVQFHALRTRRAGRRSFVAVHVLVPGAWSVKQGHDLVERLEADVRAALPGITIDTHLEPLEDPASFADLGLDRSPLPPSAGPDARPAP